MEEKLKRVRQWRKGGHNAVEIGDRIIKEMVDEYENNRRAGVVIRNGREAGKSWSAIAVEINLHGFKRSQGSSFQTVQVQRIYQRLNNFGMVMQKLNNKISSL
ncbi:hypothetical protein ACS5NO_13770 [Larkinella sp. GY13]|uniref:hypothetical protein n=1 Tax=Larkinella sp. GY13 TaxID=3453720 RepID=UPI003EECBB7E